MQTRPRPGCLPTTAHLWRRNGLTDKPKRPCGTAPVVRPLTSESCHDLSHHTETFRRALLLATSCAPLLTLSLCVRGLHVPIGNCSCSPSRSLRFLPTVERLRFFVHASVVYQSISVSLLGAPLYRDAILASHMRVESGTFFFCRRFRGTTM